MLKFKYAKKEEIPAEHQALYVERGGEWTLDTDAAPKEKLDEFRDNNIKIGKELDALKKKFDGIDPEKVRSILDQQRALDEKKLIDAGEVDKVVANRVQSLKEDHDKEAKAMKSQLKIAESRLAEITIDQAVTVESTKKGVQQTALIDITRRAREIFKLENGAPVPYRGDQKIYGKDGVTPLTIAEWVEQLVSEAPHLFAQNSGGGASGGGSGGGAQTKFNGKNPFKKETFNLTEQMKLMKGNPVLADRLKAEAGEK